MIPVVNAINDVLWGQGQLLIYLLVAIGFYLSLKLKCLQIFHFKRMVGLLAKSTQHHESGISGFQALCTSLSARVGTGNLAGVAVAISLGGPGAIFWMWLIALLGMATGYAESVLGQVYKVRDKNGEFRGGPAYYIRMGLNNNLLALLFSICLFCGYGFIFSAVQANTITDALNNTYRIPTWLSGSLIVTAAALIVAGGFKSIARFAERVVPFMAFSYIAVALLVTFLNIQQLPDVLWLIVASAFGLEEAVGGTLAAALKNGIQRGLYSNEAGSGSVPHAAAAASSIPNHPAVQGYLQMFGVFFDTIILCTCTAFIILLAGETGFTEMSGIGLTQDALSVHLGTFGGHFIAIAILFFSFTSVVANYAYGESNLHFFKLDNRIGRSAYTVGYLAMIMWGAMAALPTVWAMADMALGLMTVVNGIALFALAKTVFVVTEDFNAMSRSLTNQSAITFSTSRCRIQGKTEPSIWQD